ncbi:MAG TPA: hypothetical protein VHU89_10285 [Acidobacteriaceae bacterium]|nr:hypothetical protein [Acidobacteriaceae bacterium]
MSLPPFRRLSSLAVILVAIPLLAGPSLFAQVSYTSMPLDSGFGPLDPTPPALPVAQIIQEFTAKEAVFKQAMDNYTWQRSVRVETLDDDNKPDGQYYQVVDVVFDSEGHRTERVVDAPESSLTRVMMSPADFSDIEERLPFVLTTEDAPQYNISYLGKQRIDEIETWVFDIKPKVLEKKHRYFQGRIWVDQKDHQIAVTNGKNVPDDTRPGHEDLSIPFATYRQMVDGKYWFPVYTHGDGVLHFSAGHGYLSQNVHMRETVKYTNYHQFHTSIRVIYGGQDITGSPQKGPANPTAPRTTPSGSPSPGKPQ